MHSQFIATAMRSACFDWEIGF